MLTAEATTPTQVRGWRLVLVLTGVLLAMLLAALDQSIVGAVMPRITADLGGFEEYAWVFTAYMLGSTVTLPLWGKLSDRAAALVAVAASVPRVTARRDQRIDWPGAILIAAWAVPLLLAFSWAGTVYPWGSAHVIVALAAAAVLLVAFLLVERRAAEPIISPSFFRNDVLVVALAATFLVSVVLFGALLYLPLFLQGVVGDSAAHAGVALLPMSIAIMISNIVGGQILSRTGRYRILAVVSAVVACVGLVLLARLDDTATDLRVVLGASVTGFGIGVLMSMFTIVAQNAVPYEQLGEVTAGLQFFRSIGGTIGISALGAAMAARFQTTFDNGVPSQVHEVVSHIPGTDTNPLALLASDTAEAIHRDFTASDPGGEALYATYAEAIRHALTVAIDEVFVISAGAMGIAVVVCLILREIPLRTTNSLGAGNF